MLVRFFPALTAVQVNQSKLHAERVIISGGNHGTSQVGGNGASGLIASGSTLWLSDSSVRGGTSSGGMGATALVNVGVVPAALRQVQLVAGAPVAVRARASST